MTLALNFLGFSTTGSYKPVDVKTTTYTIVAGGIFVTDNSSNVTYTLPASARFGTSFCIVGKSGQWKIAQNANQQILLGSQSTTVGTTGSLSSTNSGDCVELICTTAGSSTVWRVRNCIGSLTVV